MKQLNVLLRKKNNCDRWFNDKMSRFFAPLLSNSLGLMLMIIYFITKYFENLRNHDTYPF